jgi:hypothetical protein
VQLKSLPISLSPNLTWDRIGKRKVVQNDGNVLRGVGGKLLLLLPST